LRIAAIIDSATGVVVPLAHGDQVWVYDTETNQLEQHANPAVHAEAHRRAVAVKFLIESNVNAVCSVPGAFCSHSYALAARSGLGFVRLEPGTPARALAAADLAKLAVSSLPPTDLHQHQHGAGVHQLHH